MTPPLLSVRIAWDSGVAYLGLPGPKNSEPVDAALTSFSGIHVQWPRHDVGHKRPIKFSLHRYTKRILPANGPRHYKK